MAMITWRRLRYYDTCYDFHQMHLISAPRAKMCINVDHVGVIRLVVGGIYGRS